MPAIGPFDNPTPGLEMRIVLSLAHFLPARFDVSDVSSAFCRLTQYGVVVALVATQMLAGSLFGRRATNHKSVQGRTELLHVVPIGTREGDRQRDAVRVREHVPFGAEFAAIRRVFAGFIPPFTGAETMAPSSDWNRQSIPFRSS